MENKKDITQSIIKACIIFAVIFVLLVLLIILLYFFAPSAYSVTTARYNCGTPEQNNEVLNALGSENTEEDFEIYFQWYNVVHELGHGLIRYNGTKKIDKVEEEQLVNDFAVAYFKLYSGEEHKLERMFVITESASKNIVSDAKEGQSYMDFGHENWNNKDFLSFKNYGWFQFNSSKCSLNSDKTLEEVLNEMGIVGYNIPSNPEKLYYDEVDETVSDKVIMDAVNNIRSWGLEYPDVHHSFNDDPNKNYSRPVKSIFSLDIPDFKYLFD